MAVAIDKTTTATGTGSLSFLHTPVGTPTFVAVDVGLRGSGNPSVTVTYGGVSTALYSSFSHGSLRLFPFSLENPASGAKTVQVTITGGTVNQVLVACRTYTGTPTSSTFDTFGGTFSTGVFPSAGMTVTTGKRAHAVALIDKGQSTSIDPSGASGITELFDITAGASGDRPRMAGGDAGVTAGGYSAAWVTTASVDWIAWGMILNAVPVYKDIEATVNMAFGVTANPALIANALDVSAAVDMAFGVTATAGLITKKDISASVAMAFSASAALEIGHRALISAIKRFAISQLTLRNRDRNIEIVARQV